MIDVLEQALQRLTQQPRPQALLGAFASSRVSVSSSEVLTSGPIDGAKALLSHAPLDGLLDGAGELETLLNKGKLHGWLTCQSEAFLIDGTWKHEPVWGAVLDADLALGDTIGLQIRHLGHSDGYDRWAVTTIVEHPATSGTGCAVLAENVDFMRRGGAGDEGALLSYRRYWDVTADGLAFTYASRLVAIDRKGQG